MAAKPLELQRLEASLDMGPFMQYAHDVLSRPLTCSSESEDDESLPPPDELQDSTDKLIHGVLATKSDRIGDKIRVYNFSNVGQNRKWLQDVLLSDTDSDPDMSEDEYIREMLRDHAQEDRLRTKYYRDPNNIQYGYYGAGLLSNYDMFPEHQRSVIGSGGGKNKGRKMAGMREKRPYRKSQKMAAKSDTEDMDFDLDLMDGYDLDDPDFDSRPNSPRSKRRKALLKTPEALARRRRKVWQLMAKKEVGKVQRARATNHKEVVTNCKKVATLCMKVCRQRAMQSQKNMRETVWRAKRLTREMLSYWKRYDRVERETRRRLEKEAEEQRKMDVEKIEVKRQQRKLNFLITQTELYAHFMSKKLCDAGEEEENRILSQLDEEVVPRLASLDHYDSELMKQQAQKNASEAFHVEQERTSQFNLLQKGRLMSADELVDELPQPKIFKGLLKGYQLKGMTWLANLYNQGISGILADEMGLGKTVQSIAFLCHIAEQYGVWGPFLIISPASTLHNWQQEMQRFVKDFKVVPYWGSPNERKILRQFWEQKDLHTKDASFHVVITSYQIVVSDYKYFNRIKWQYMVLDEAQAIKSSSSVRWKLLLGFNCRNRLLLSGTPIQNSMAELWALLHFIMPTLFDSHDEFNEWFSKDIESHAENKTGIDEKQISRLHMILKPFMLRRIKKDVENELSDKIEIMVYCPLTTRQKLLYTALKKKIRIEDLLKMTGNGAGGSSDASVDKNFTSNLMNLVMQFRKVCNHPELFERRDVRSPFAVRTEEFVLPRLVYEEGLLASRFPRRDHLIYNKFNIFKAENVTRSLFPKDERDKLVDYTKRIKLMSTFSFARFCDLSPGELEKLKTLGMIYSLNHCRHLMAAMILLHHRRAFQPQEKSLSTMLLEPTIEAKLNPQFIDKSSVLRKLLFVTRTSTVYGHHKHSVCSMQETMEHRIIRSKQFLQKVKIEELPVAVVLKPEAILKSPGKNQIEATSSMILVEEFPHVPLPPKEFECQATEMPTFVFNIPPKVQASGRRLYCEHRGAQWEAIRHEQCENAEGRSMVYSAMAEAKPRFGWSFITIPDKQTLVSDCGKLAVLDALLTRLKSEGHRVLIYSQMTKMIDLLEEFMWHRKHRYMRLDGSSKISARRDMVADFQNRADIFVFLLSTRAGGLGINLTAADTVIFYDSDWNPTVDQQAMDRAHRLGQTKQVTVYRLICKGTIEERILQRAREKSEIQRMVISGGNFKPDTLKPKEVVSLLLDDDEIETKYRQKTDEGPDSIDEAGSQSAPTGIPSTPTTGASRTDKDRDRKRKANAAASASGTAKSTATGDARSSETSKRKTSSRADMLHLNDGAALVAAAGTAAVQMGSTGVLTPSSSLSEQSYGSSRLTVDAALFDDPDESSNEALVVDYDSPKCSPGPFISQPVQKPKRKRASRAGGGSGVKRGRPKTAPKGGLGALLDTLGQTETPDDTTTTSQGKRGPGRPRAKAGSSSGFRSAPRIRKPAAPLVVPLGQSPAPTPPGPSPAMSPAPSPAPPDRGLGFYQPMNEDI